MERNGHAYLLPSDAQVTDDVTFLEETAVSVSRMHERIKATGVGQVLVLLDACRNDPGGRADAPNPLTEAYTRGFNFDVRNREVQAFATLYATAVGYRAYEYSEKKQGYFTWALVEGLKGGAANERGEVTLARLVDYVQTVVPKRVGIDLGSGKVQQPFAVVEGYKADGLVLALAGAGAAGAPADPSALEVSFWESVKDSKDPGDFRAYLEKYPEGSFAALARRRSAEPAPTAAGPAALTTADEVIERSITAAGGKEALQKFTSIAVKGTYEFTQGGQTMSGVFEQYYKLPDKVYMLINVPKAFRQEEGFDGEVGWTKTSQGVMVMSGWQLAFKRRSTEMGFIFDINHLKEFYPKSVLKGVEKVDGRDAYAVEMTPTVGKPETLYFDKQTGLMIRWDVMYESGRQQGVAFPVQLFAEGYADVNGMMMPMVYRYVSPSQTSVMRFVDVKFNVPLDESKFRKPGK
jgi:outer membrane lipoprotein-sorting protein